MILRTGELDPYLELGQIVLDTNRHRYGCNFVLKASDQLNETHTIYDSIHKRRVTLKALGMLNEIDQIYTLYESG